MVAKWAEARRIAFTTYHNLAEHPEVLGLLAEEVRKVNATLPEPQRIRRFVSLYKELDPDDGELTRTRKVRRAVIDERYARIIAGDLCRPAARAGRDRGDLRGRPQGPDRAPTSRSATSPRHP